jgi:HdeA/HdeB family
VAGNGNSASLERIMKNRLLLTSTLFVLVHIPAQAQVTLDVAEITCEQIVGEKLPWPSKYIGLWLNGYYNGKRNNTIIEPESLQKDSETVEFYCLKHPETTIMDAIKNVLGFDK